MKTVIKYISIVCLMIACCQPASPQGKEIDFLGQYITELQMNFTGKFNWMNLISLQAGAKPWKNGSVDMNVLSVFETNRNRIIGDIQGFSNIEANNMAINIYLMGYTHGFGNVSLFFGIRNINIDYTNPQYRSVFTHSSPGLFPTVSINFPSPNYPLSAVCIHAEGRFTKYLTLKSSWYNGVARKLLDGGRIFTVNPRRDGIFSMSEIEYSPEMKYYGYYAAGVAIHTGFTRYVNGLRERREFNYAIWASVEQTFYKDERHEAGFFAQASFSPRGRSYCRNYYGLGVVLKGSLFFPKSSDCIGVSVNHASFSTVNETAFEATCQSTLKSRYTIQPAFHYIITGKKGYTAGIIRFCYNIKVDRHTRKNRITDSQQHIH